MRYWKDEDEKKAKDDFGKIAVSTKLPDYVGMSQDGTKEISNILGEKSFGYPKSVKLINFLIKISSNQNSIILDFFAGSGTTGHAVLDLNKSDGGNRTFILCQLNEKTDANPDGIAYDNLNAAQADHDRRVLRRLKEFSVVTGQRALRRKS